MSGIPTINSANFRSGVRTRRAAASNCSVLSMRRCIGVKAKKDFSRKSKGNSVAVVDFGMELKNAWLILAFCVVLSGGFYLYQVNDLADKGYELKKLQNSVAGLQEENKKGRIQEVELMSMYNIEKTTQDLNLVNSSKATYIELNSPVAMK